MKYSNYHIQLLKQKGNSKTKQVKKNNDLLSTAKLISLLFLIIIIFYCYFKYFSYLFFKLLIHIIMLTYL